MIAKEANLIKNWVGLMCKYDEHIIFLLDDLAFDPKLLNSLMSFSNYIKR